MEAKEERQRLLLAGLLLVGVLYGYFGLLLSPMNTGIAQAGRAVEDRNQQISSIGVELRALREEIAMLDRPILDTAAKELLETVPTSHLVFTPAILSRILDEHRLSKGLSRSVMVAPFYGREDLHRASWEISLSEAGALRVGQAVAAVENEFRLSQLSEVSFEASTASGTVSATVTLELVIHR